MNKSFINQLVVNAWILLSLIVGFAVTIIVPRLAILRLGETGYGLYALIAGFAAVLGFADLGLIPGITKSLSKSVAEGSSVIIRIITRRIELIVFLGIMFLGALCLGVILFSSSLNKSEIIFSLTLFSISAYISTITEIRLSILRLKGFIEYTYKVRIGYLVCYLLFVTLFYFTIPVWGGVGLLFVAQLISAFAFFLVVVIHQRSSRPNNQILNNLSTLQKQEVDLLWSNIFKISAPERFNKILQFINGLIERPMIAAMGGLALVGSFDLMMRLMIIVSAIPGALNQPLLSMLSHDLVRQKSERRFHQALRLTRLISLVTALLGLVVSLIIFSQFHQRIFGVLSLIPMSVFVVIAFSTALNVLTASGSALFISQGIIWPCNWKVAIEGIGIALGVTLGLIFGSVFLFVIFRYSFLLLAALFLLIVERTLKANTK